jgi:hypothetical protein
MQTESKPELSEIFLVNDASAPRPSPQKDEPLVDLEVVLVQPVRQLSVLRLFAKLLHLPQPLVIFKHLHAVALILKLEHPLNVLFLRLGTPALIERDYVLLAVSDDSRVHVGSILVLHRVNMFPRFNKVQVHVALSLPVEAVKLIDLGTVHDHWISIAAQVAD